MSHRCMEGCGECRRLRERKKRDAARITRLEEALRRIEDENVCEGYCDPPLAMCANCIAVDALKVEAQGKQGSETPAD